MVITCLRHTSHLIANHRSSRLLNFQISIFFFSFTSAPIIFLKISECSSTHGEQNDHLHGLVARASDFDAGGPGSNPGAGKIFFRVLQCRSLLEVHPASKRLIGELQVCAVVWKKQNNAHNWSDVPPMSATARIDTRWD